MTRPSRLLAAMVLAVLVAPGCGGDDDSAPLELSYVLAKPCVAKGEAQSIETRTDDNVEIAYAVTYPDGKFHGEAPRGHTDDDGVFEASWEIPTEVPAGRTTVRILAAEGPRSDTATVPFHITSEEVPCPAED